MNLSQIRGDHTSAGASALNGGNAIVNHSRIRGLVLLVLCVFVVLGASAGLSSSAVASDDPASEEYFEKHVRPVLAGTCFRCHGGQKIGGKLHVDSREALIKGGESGAAIDLESPEKSLLLAAIRRDDDVSAMPPDKALPEKQVAAITAWIKAGAPWPKTSVAFVTEKHWAFEPLTNPAAPEVKDKAWSRTSVDPFILAPLEAAGRSPSPAADRRTLLRRVTYDLTGLPPTPAEYEAFEKDQSRKAYADVVDRLLASNAYGEHWGRHWLDVVRYADTAGENSDHPLPHAWRYRNWVIDALNRDLPYDQFIREQIAGDLIAKDGPPELAQDRIVATGYLAIARRFGHEIDKEMHLTIEDTLDTMGKSVLGLSIGCTRCHDHKFDPLTVNDYYGLYGIFESTKFSFPGCEPVQQPRDLVPLPLSAEAAEQVKRIDLELTALEEQVKNIAAIQDAAAKEIQGSFAKATVVLSRGEIEEGKDATLDSGKTESLDHVAVKQGEMLLLSILPRTNHGADTTLVELSITETTGEKRVWSVADLVNDFPAGNPHADVHGSLLAWCFLDLQAGPKLLAESLLEISGQRDLQAWRNGDTPSVFVNRSTNAVKVWTELAPRSFFMHPGPQGPVGIAWICPGDMEVAIAGRIADAHVGGPDGVGWKLERIASAEMGRKFIELGEQRMKFTATASRKAELMSMRPPTPVAYAVTEGTAKNARIHKRGEPADLGEEAPRKFLDILGGSKLETTGASGRLELANWLTSKTNPLTPRVIANRVWQWHFGRGIVATPNDFGTRGTPPTHPQLLDHLANELVNSGWSLKALHRKILLSATYQQAAGDAHATALYGAFARRRVSVEELRDTLLIAGGELDRTPAGPHPFPPEATWSFTQHGPFAAEYETNKRSVYVMQKRNRRNRFFALFDGPDPNSSTATRDVTTVPTQALFFLNDPMLHAQAGKFAARVTAHSADAGEQIRYATSLLFGRVASKEEIEAAQDFLKQYAATLTDVAEAERAQAAWQAYARVLLSSSEVMHVD